MFAIVDFLHLLYALYLCLLFDYKVIFSLIQTLLDLTMFWLRTSNFIYIESLILKSGNDFEEEIFDSNLCNSIFFYKHPLDGTPWIFRRRLNSIVLFGFTWLWEVRAIYCAKNRLNITKKGLFWTTAFTKKKLSATQIDVAKQHLWNLRERFFSNELITGNNKKTSAKNTIL